MNSKTSSPLLGPAPQWPLEIVRGRGMEVVDRRGRRYSDWYGGHCVAILGHSPAVLRRALSHQLRRLVFYSTAVRLDVRERAARRLLALAGTEGDGIFFCNSGAEANENALKIAVEVTGRHRFVAFEGSFHGRTLLALSVTDSPALRAPFQGLLAPTEFLPWGEEAALEKVDWTEVAAVIVEPIQSMAGVRTAPEGWFRALTARAHAAGALVVADEIQTGLGRTGSWFLSRTLGLEPDVLTLAKGLAAGVPVAALVVRRALHERLGPQSLGSTFGGGPLACRAVLATLEALERLDAPARARALEEDLRRRLAVRSDLVLRGRGLLLGLEARGRGAELREHLLGRGILAGGSRDPDVVRLMPPLVAGPKDVARLAAAVLDFPSSPRAVDRVPS
jgi:acetylornithine/N-succinyldiaminopimelate aminotransferase